MKSELSGIEKFLTSIYYNISTRSMSARDERRMKPGKDIEPLAIEDFDIATVYLRQKVAYLQPLCLTALQNLSPELFTDAVKTPKQEKNVSEKLDDILKDTILKENGCPELIKRLSIDRPSVFDILASTYRYRPELIAIQRDILKKVRSNQLSGQAGYYECFKRTHPNSAMIIRDLQKEALDKQSKSDNINMQ